MTTPDLDKARKNIRLARELSFVAGIVFLLGSLTTAFLVLTLPAKRFSPVYNQAWLREQFEHAALPADKDRAVYSLLDVIATMDHYYFVGGILLLAFAMLMSFFAFTFYRYVAKAADHLNERA